MCRPDPTRPAVYLHPELSQCLCTISLYDRPICSGWIAAAKAEGVEIVETAPALGLLLSVKDTNEIDNIKRASILTNKVKCEASSMCVPGAFL